ncbi:conserved protein of unknown function [Pseudomonas marincola]|uniref:Uncharacterized protein n=1 Tax=Pseudomonas marincola TaxID=437900 RepID=A0A653E944_9PSED|nr:conserved protein of unknown function [Pseudomonas marincola]
MHSRRWLPFSEASLGFISEFFESRSGLKPLKNPSDGLSSKMGCLGWDGSSSDHSQTSPLLAASGL